MLPGRKAEVVRAAAGGGPRGGDGGRRHQRRAGAGRRRMSASPWAPAPTWRSRAPGVTLVKGDLRGIVRARRLSRATMRNIRQNLFFAFVYNALGVPLAAGVLYPVLRPAAEPDDRERGDDLLERQCHLERAAAAPSQVVGLRACAILKAYGIPRSTAAAPPRDGSPCGRWSARPISSPRSSSCRCSCVRAKASGKRSAPCPATTRCRSTNLVKECEEVKSLGHRRRHPVRHPGRRRTNSRRALTTGTASSSAPSAPSRQSPELLVITDVCNCEYTSHGHCGKIVNGRRGQ